MREIPLRAWATPLALATFVLMAGTGVLMFFGINSGITDVVHQWFSWLFLVAIGAHLALHVRSVSRHLQSWRVRLCVGIFAILLMSSLFTWGTVTGPQLSLRMPAQAQSLLHSPVLSVHGRMASTAAVRPGPAATMASINPRTSPGPNSPSFL